VGTPRIAAVPTLESDSGVGLSPHSPGHVGVRAVEPAGDRLVGVPSTTQKIRAPDVTMKSENLRIALVENSEPHIDMTYRRGCARQRLRAGRPVSI
jgi:hypothetical protein